MRIANIQFAPALLDLQATIGRLDRLLCKAQKADLVVLPELANSGYNFSSREEAFSVAEPIFKSLFLSFLQMKCIEHSFHVVTGFNELDEEDGKIYNSAVLVGSEGVVGCYRKLHLFQNEKHYFEPGNLGLPLFEVDGMKIGMLVCFDWTFPETWRIMALNGAQLICHPSNLVLPGFAQRVIPAHAIMNRVFIATANRIGIEGELTFTGNSIIVDPKGNELVRGGEGQEEILWADINPELANDKMLTPLNHSFEDRRIDVYQLEEK